MGKRGVKLIIMNENGEVSLIRGLGAKSINQSAPPHYAMVLYEVFTAFINLLNTSWKILGIPGKG